MASKAPSGPQGEGSGADPGVDIAQAFQDLARGEQTAQSLESNLSSLEQKLDALLKSLEDSEAVKKLDSQGKEGEEKKDAKETGGANDGTGISGQ